MTNLQALKATIEFGYTNDNLFTKVLLDNGVTAGDTYTASYKSNIDMALVDVCKYLKSHPKIKQGDTDIEFDLTALSNIIDDILGSYDLSTTTQIAKGKGPTISAEPIW